MYDDDDQLVLAGHPDFPGLVAVAANQTGGVAPSWVVSITPRKDAASIAQNDVAAPVSVGTKVPAVQSHQVETLFQSNGIGFSSSSTGLRDSLSGVLYVSGLYAEEGVMVCKPSGK